MVKQPVVELSQFQLCQLLFDPSSVQLGGHFGRVMSVHKPSSGCAYRNGFYVHLDVGAGGPDDVEVREIVFVRVKN